MFGIGKKKEKAAAPAPSVMAETAIALQPAGFWLRVVAFIVDYALLLILGGAMMMGAASAGGEEMLGIVYWLWILVTFLYWPVLESTSRRATVGKGLLGLVVADIDGGRLSFVRSLLRNLAKIISSIPLGIGFLLAAFTSRKQALHDLITKAVVLRLGSSSLARALGVLVLGLLLLVLGSYLVADYMMAAMPKDMQAMMSGDAPMQAKPAAVSKPAPKPAAAPVVKPAAPAPAAQVPAPVAQAPAPAPVVQAPAPAPVAKPAPAPAAKPAPVKVAVAPKPAAMQEPKPAPAPAAPVQFTPPRLEALQPPSGPAMAPPPIPPGPLSPRFNDVMTAVLYADRVTVSQLLDLGRWPDKRDSNGLTPLMVAAMTGNADMARLLLERDADPNLQAPGGVTALEFARQSGDAVTTQLLLRSGAR